MPEYQYPSRPPLRGHRAGPPVPDPSSEVAPTPRRDRKRRFALAAIVASVIGGGATGAAITSMSAASAQTPTPTPSPSATAPAAPDAAAGAFKSNEDSTHEGTETPEQEAAEDAGKRPSGHGGPRGAGGPNEDPTHEASESPEREAAEHPAGAQAPTPAPSASPTS